MVVGSLAMLGHWHVPPPWAQAVCVGVVEQSMPSWVPPTHFAGWQSGSLQSISPSQSLSIMSLQWPASGPVGVQTVVVVVLVVVVVVVTTVVVVVAIVVVVLLVVVVGVVVVVVVVGGHLQSCRHVM